MGEAAIQLIVLAAIALFLILRLRSVLGTREGFEPTVEAQAPMRERASNFEVIEGGVDQDIADHVDVESEMGQALRAMKTKEPGFSVGEFLSGAGQAYEMILMAYENDDRETLENLLADDVYEGFSEALDARADQGLRVDAEFVGLRENRLYDASFDVTSGLAEITLKFQGELTSVVTDIDGKVVEGSKTDIKRQKDIWTFARVMGSEDPNWELVATEA